MFESSAFAVLALAFSLPTAAQLAATAATEVAVGRVGSRVENGEHAGIVGFSMSLDGVSIASVQTEGADANDLRSTTKSITALLIGIAIDRGELDSVDQPLMPLLPEWAMTLADDPRKRAITIADLLTMRSRFDCDDWNKKFPGHEDRMYRKRDWIAFWARQPMRDVPGEHYSYCTGNAIALGAILRHVSGKSVDDFADEFLSTPLGITGARWAKWNRGREVDSGGHLHLSTDALLRSGELVLQRGEFNGRRIVSSQWIDAMTAERTSIPDRPQRYGYLWWLDATTRPELPRTRLQMAWGNGGNVLIVLPEQNAVIAFAGTRFNRPDALEPLLWVRDELLTSLNNRETHTSAQIDGCPGLG